MKCSLVDLSTSVSVSPPPSSPPLFRGLGGFGWCARCGFVQQERSTQCRLRRQAGGNGEDVSCVKAYGFPSPHNPLVFMGVVVHLRTWPNPVNRGLPYVVGRAENLRACELGCSCLSPISPELSLQHHRSVVAHDTGRRLSC